MNNHNNDQSKIKSVEIAFKVLQTLVEKKEAMSLSELSQHTGLHKSQLYRYLNTFVQLGVMIRHDEKYPKWTLGPELIAIGDAALESMDLSKEAKPYLTKLRDSLNETVSLSIWRKEGPFFLKWEKSNKLVSIGLDTWSYVPLYSATGKIFRAFLSKDKTEALYQEEVLAGKINPEKYEQDIRIVKEQEYAVTESSWLPGIAALSVPIFYPHKILAGGISIIGVQGGFDTSENSMCVRELKKVGNEISSVLGYKTF